MSETLEQRIHRVANKDFAMGQITAFASDIAEILKERDKKIEEFQKHISSLLEAIENEMIISDDEGLMWYWGLGKIRLVSAELELKTIEEIMENGYYCENFDDGITLLKEYGYITDNNEAR